MDWSSSCYINTHILHQLVLEALKSAISAIIWRILACGTSICVFVKPNYTLPGNLYNYDCTGSSKKYWWKRCQIHALSLNCLKFSPFCFVCMLLIIVLTAIFSNSLKILVDFKRWINISVIKDRAVNQKCSYIPWTARHNTAPTSSVSSFESMQGQVLDDCRNVTCLCVNASFLRESPPFALSC